MMQVVERWTGGQADALRQALRMSLERFAERVEMSPRQVANWRKQPDIVPRPYVQRILDSMLESADDRVKAQFAAASNDAANVRSVNEAPAKPEPSNLVVPYSGESSNLEPVTTDDVIGVLSRIHRLHKGVVHPEIVSQLEGNIHNTIAKYESLDHSSLLPALLRQRAWIDEILGECNHPAQLQQLMKSAGATTGVLGYLAVGRGDFPLARAYCLEAFELGRFAQDENLQAWARGLQSFCEYYAGRYTESLHLAQDGLKYAGSGPQSVRLVINGVARAMGKLGDIQGVHRAVDEAHDLLSRNSAPAGVPSSIALGCYSVAQTASNAATAYVSLAIPDKVQYFADLALPDISKSDSPWSRSLVQIDIAFSLVRAREADLDHATELVLDALAISKGRPIIAVQQRTSEFVHSVIDRWGRVPEVNSVLDAASTVRGGNERDE